MKMDQKNEIKYCLNIAGKKRSLIFASLSKTDGARVSEFLILTKVLKVKCSWFGSSVG